MSDERGALYWLSTAIVWLGTALLVLIVCWWVHGERNVRRLTREVGGWLAILGGLRCWWDLAQGAGLIVFGALLWRLAGRFSARHLDDTPVMGRSAAGSGDADDDDEE